MHRGDTDDEYFSATKHNAVTTTATIEGEKQKQKKKLTFKEPEIETRQSYDFKPTLAYKQQTHKQPTYKQNKESTKSLEDLTLEDQALEIVKHVGQAFISPSKTIDINRKSLTLPRTSFSKETDITERVKPEDSIVEETKQRKVPKVPLNQNSAATSKPISKSLVPVTSSTMRCPVIEIASEDDSKPTGKEDSEVATRGIDHVTSSSKTSELDSDWPTGARHQIQLLNLHLEQQRQQTKTAMSQIRLFKDQLEAETAARYQAQEQNTELMNQNKDLIDQIQQLFQQIRDLEKQLAYQKNTPYLQQPLQQPDPKPVGLAPPSLSQYGLRRNSGSLWSNTLSPGLGFIRRNSSTPQPDTPESNPKNVLNDAFSRRTSITEDLATISNLRFGSSTDWRLRRRGSNNLTFDFSTKGKFNNGFSDEPPSPSPTIDRTKITPLFASDSKPDKGTTEESQSDAGFESRKATSLLIDDTTANESNSATNYWSSKNFKPIEPDDRRCLTYDRRENKRDATQCQSMLSKSIDTLRLFNS